MEGHSKIATTAMIFVLIACLAMAACSPYSVHPNIGPDRYPIHRLAIVTFRTDIVVAALGTHEEATSAEEEQFRGYLTAGLIKSLGRMKIEAASLDTLIRKLNLPQSMTQQIKFDLGLERQKAVSDVALNYRERFTYRCSEQIAELARQLDVDGFVFLDFEGVRRSNADYALAFLRSSLFALLRGRIFTEFPGRSFVSGDVQIIDGSSGDLIYFNEVDAEEADFRDADDVDSVMKGAFEPFLQRFNRIS